MTLGRLHHPEPHLIAALVTPFTAAGEIDTASLTRLVAHLQQHGINEFFAVGSTGESPLLDRVERLTIIETVRGAAPNGLIYAGVSGTGHRHAIRNARDSAAAGADVAVLMSPYFVSLNQDHLFTFCTLIADQSPIPTALYHHLRMPTGFTVPTVARLAAHPNVLAIKDTNGSQSNRCVEMLAATQDREFLFFQGVEKLALSTLAVGGHGCVLAQACIAPWLFRGLFDAWRAEDHARAQILQKQIDAIWGIFSRREVKQSFFHFLHTLKLPLQQQGIIASTAAAIPNVVFEPAFEQMLTNFLQQHLVDAPTTP